MKNLLATLLAGATVLAAGNASAFCGFYVGGAGAELFNDASQVVLMRDGTKTILSMQNRYEGPVDDFALVIPVPEVLMEANVKTLDESVFAKLDQLTAPRLVEYFEEDPCHVDVNNTAGNNAPSVDTGVNNTNNVVVEAQFEVGEYQIVVLSATESTSLGTYLTDNGYNIPAGAAPYYQPYIDAGMYFFVARVDPDKVTFDGDRAVLSPLRFDYDSDTFLLPIRLGMINSAGQQDIIIHTLGRNQRYDLANYGNVTIPTNLELAPQAKSSFPTFYKTLFARTVQANPGAVVTEYAWQASNCDPCPGPVVDASDLLTLGADVLGNDAEYDQSWVITRLHARYEKDDIGEDLIFRAADPIAGGREHFVNGDRLEEGALPSEINNFQGRYIIRHPWSGPITCEDPGQGYWGPPQATGSAQGPTSTGDTLAGDDSYDLAPNLVDDVPELGIEGTGTRAQGTERNNGTVNNGTGGTDNNGNGTGGGTTDGTDGLDGEKIGGGGCSTAGGAGSLGLMLFVGLGLVRRRGRR